MAAKRFLYRLLGTDKALGGPDCINGFVIAAPDAASARKCAFLHASDEGVSTWLDPELSVCDQIGECTGIHPRPSTGPSPGDPADTEVVLYDVG